MSLDSVRPWRQISRRKSREISVGNEKILFNLLEKKPIIPSEKEIKLNPPSRSAKLRYVIKKNEFHEFKTDIFKKFQHLIKIENLGNRL